MHTLRPKLRTKSEWKESRGWSSLLLSLVSFCLLLMMLLVSLFFGSRFFSPTFFFPLPCLGCWLLHNTTHSLFLPSPLFLFRIELTQCVRGLSWERGHIFSFLRFVSLFPSLFWVSQPFSALTIYFCVRMDSSLLFLLPPFLCSYHFPFWGPLSIFTLFFFLE